MNYKKITLSVILVWFLIITFAVIKNEYTLANGREVLLKTIPIDPRDLFMGDYVILNYEIKQMPHQYRYSFYQNKPIWVELETQKDNIARIKKIYETKPQKGIFLKGNVDNCYNRRKRHYNNTVCSSIKYEIENYFVKESVGRKLEKELQNGALVRVSIDKFGNAKIKGFKN